MLSLRVLSPHGRRAVVRMDSTVHGATVHGTEFCPHGSLCRFDLFRNKGRPYGMRGATVHGIPLPRRRGLPWYRILPSRFIVLVRFVLQ